MYNLLFGSHRFFTLLMDSENGEIFYLHYRNQVVLELYAERVIQEGNMLLFSFLQILMTIKGRVCNSPLRQGQFQLGGW